MKHKIEIPLSLMMTLLMFSREHDGPTAFYTLKDILRVALENNNNIVKAKYDYEEGQAKTKEVKSAALPQVNINADLSDNVIRQAMIFPKMFADPTAGPDDYTVLRAGMQYSASVSGTGNTTGFQ